MKIYLKGYTILYPSINEEEQVILLSSLLRDAALEFWRYRTGGRVDNNDSRVPRKLSTAFELLTGYFSPSNEERVARWNGLHQVDSISQLAETCCILHNVITPPMNQAQLKEKFLSAIDASIMNIIEEDHYLFIEDISFEKLVHAALKAESIANQSYRSGRTVGSSSNSQQVTAVQIGSKANSSWRSTLPMPLSQSLEKYHGNKQSKDMNQVMIDTSLPNGSPDQQNTARQPIPSKSSNNISPSADLQSRVRRDTDSNKSPNNVFLSNDMHSRSRQSMDLSKSSNSTHLNTDVQSRSRHSMDLSKSSNHTHLNTDVHSRSRRDTDLNKSSNNMFPNSDMQSRAGRIMDSIPLNMDTQSRSKRGMDFSKMPKKGDKEWREYCFARNACLNCGQLTHTKSACPDRKD